MKQTLLSFLAALLILFAFGCKKDPVLTDPVPAIEFIEISPQTVQEYADSVIITFSYQDGDGDLGENDPNVKNCFVFDSRINEEYSFRIQQLAPDNAEIPIQGQVNIILPPLGSTTGNTESVSFDVYVLDRAGNKSNTVTTLPISIVP